MSDDELAGVLTAHELEALQFGYRERVTDMQLPHIRELPQVLPGLFADAAVRAEQAGFDGVELHYAHAYTMASFLSRTNTRDDGYGGARENRAAAAARSVRRSASPRRATTSPSAAAFSPTNASRAAATSSDAVVFGAAFARAGMDFLSTSRGGKFDDAKQPRGRRRRLSLYRAERLRMHAAIYFRRARAVRPQRRADCGDSQGRARRRQERAGCLHRRHPQFRDGRRLSWRAASATSSARRASRSPIRIGSAKRARATAPRCGCANTPIIAKGSTRSTSRSRASSGTSCRPLRANGARPTASVGLLRRFGSRRVERVGGSPRL